MSPSLAQTGFDRMFRPDQLTVGVFFPIEAYRGSIPTMQNQAGLAQRAEALGYAALWVRDVPLYDPTFGDVGQIFDPWVYLGYIAAQTDRIALATGSIIFSQRHPLHLAKAAASVDQLSNGRLVMGVASGDRPVEFPAFGVDFESRGDRFRQTFADFKQALASDFPVIRSSLTQLEGADVLPKPVNGGIPLLVTGHSRQTPEWIAEQADGWLYYPRHPQMQARMIQDWRTLVDRVSPGTFKPYAQSLYVDLVDDPTAAPTPIHLGYRLGRDRLLDLFRHLRDIGVNHVGLNLKYGQRPAAEVLEEIGQEILPHLPAEVLTHDQASVS
ncbi:LLM class oxidoreductase [Leptolyngbya sp. CCNP1308]|uniref:LLM class oxidoreductase n=1 Tax=Leptolyngbya sp. CCNP1308 TaxID=3110255 RepID=UPI002B1FED4A|nr:LLM class oxidoreductase [Leptolyngbya sp. CCNP1308]MEA5447360.1 LLM class oxidoreductase [Leptolyngbya sp. CCNP1308]